MPLSLVAKIVRADECRRSRFHDEKGNLVSWNRLLWNCPRAYATGFARLALGIRPASPWISYDATRVLKRFLTREARVLEFGSGMSTLWFARRAGFVHSVEGCEPWYRTVSHLIAAKGIRNVEYGFATSPNEYVSAGAREGLNYDLVMVDGDFRSECVRRAVNHLRRPGVLYLDNSDKDSGPRGGDLRLAESMALDFAKRMEAEVRYFTDFAPTQLTPNQGLMVLVA